MLEIGQHVAIAPNATIVISSNPNNSVLHKFIFFKNKNVKIENDVWLGVNVVIQLGAIISHTSIVAANSVVTRNVEPYSIMSGVSAKKIGDIDDRKYKP